MVSSNASDVSINTEGSGRVGPTPLHKLLGLTAQQVAERAGITRQTLARLEHGHATVGLDVFLNVARAVGQLDAVVKAADPYETDFGRARSEATLPQRVRH